MNYLSDYGAKMNAMARPQMNMGQRMPMQPNANVLQMMAMQMQDRRRPMPMQRQGVMPMGQMQTQPRTL
jgi:hypothetical protein